MNGVQIIRAEDPQGVAFKADGYVLVGEGWGARLRLTEPPDLMKIRQAVTRAEESGIAVQELRVEYADALYDLELANNADYPYTPTTGSDSLIWPRGDGYIWPHRFELAGGLVLV